MLEDHLPKSRFKQPGERVVQGQRMMQAASDIFLGWTKGAGGEPPLLLAPAPRHEGLGADRVDEAARASTFYARICGWTLARAHARSGDPIAIAAYLGNERRVRPVDHRLLRALRRPERAGLPGIRDSHPVRAAGGARRRLTTDARAGGPGMNAEFFALAFTAALNPKLLALDLLLIENRRPRAMFLSVLLGGMTVALTIGLLDVLTVHADAITSQGKASAGVDLALACSCWPSAGCWPLAACTAGGGPRSRPGPGRRTSRRRRMAGRSGYWPSRGSGWPCWSAR